MTDKEQKTSQDEWTVIIDEDLEDLIPGYLENRHQDILLILSALENNDFETIRFIGHKMKGSGGGYGFGKITEIGQDLETAAKSLAGREIHKQVSALRDYLGRIKVVFSS